MRTCKSICLAIMLAGTLAGTVSAQTTQTADQTQPQVGTSTAAPVVTVDQAIDRIIAREHDEVATIRRFSPLIETYIQDMKADKEMGAIPVKDHYFLGQADLSKGIVDNSMLHPRKGKFDQFNPLSHMSGFFTSSYVPEGFLQMIYLDTSGFDRQHYQFDYVRREFLGEVRCVVFDVTPLPKSGKGRFKGRIWAEDQTFTIVRFNGVYTPIAGINGFNLHFDSWRLNVQPGLVAARVHLQPGIRFEGFSGRRHSLQVANASVGLQPEERGTPGRIQRDDHRIAHDSRMTRR